MIYRIVQPFFPLFFEPAPPGLEPPLAFGAAAVFFLHSLTNSWKLSVTLMLLYI